MSGRDLETDIEAAAGLARMEYDNAAEAERKDLEADAAEMIAAAERDRHDRESLRTAKLNGVSVADLEDKIWHTEVARIATGMEGVDCVVQLRDFRDILGRAGFRVGIAGVDDETGAPLVEIEELPKDGEWPGPVTRTQAKEVIDEIEDKHAASLAAICKYDAETCRQGARQALEPEGRALYLRAAEMIESDELHCPDCGGKITDGECPACSFEDEIDAGGKA